MLRTEADDVLPEPAENKILLLEFGRGDFSPAQPFFVPLSSAGLLRGAAFDRVGHRETPRYTDGRWLHEPGRATGTINLLTEIQAAAVGRYLVAKAPGVSSGYIDHGYETAWELACDALEALG